LKFICPDSSHDLKLIMAHLSQMQLQMIPTVQMTETKEMKAKPLKPLANPPDSAVQASFNTQPAAACNSSRQVPWYLILPQL
jgi:hypothetical protein